MAESYFLDSNQEHFKYTDYPLTYSTNTLEPALAVFTTHVEYLKALDDYLKKVHPEVVMTANCVSEGPASFGFPFLAALPFECAEPRFNWGDREFNYRRAMALKRPAIAVDCFGPRGPVTEEQARQHVLDFTNTCLLYAFYPRETKFLERFSDIEVARPILEKYIPLFDELSSAGWEPITFARSELPDIAIERYGDPSHGVIYFTVQNRYPGLKKMILSIDKEALGVRDDDFTATEIVSGEEIQVEVNAELLKLQLEIEPSQTLVLKITT